MFIPNFIMLRFDLVWFGLVWVGLVSLLLEILSQCLLVLVYPFILEQRMKKLIGSQAAHKGLAILWFTIEISCALAICGVIP